MFSHRYNRLKYSDTTIFSSNTLTSSLHVHHRETLPNTIQSHYSSNSPTIHPNSLLQFPNSGNSSCVTNLREGHKIGQPYLNPHKSFLNRSIDTCPTHLTAKQKNKWLKTGGKARANQHLVSTTPRFHWPETHYEYPFHIHHRTPISSLQLIIQKVADVRLYAIDTESDKPTKSRRHLLPSLLQVQAIHNEHLATVLLIEVQHLPHPSTTLFHTIQQLCRTIFFS